MGRYTTVQTYSDNNPKVASVTYEQASGGNEVKPGETNKGLKVEKVSNPYGSSAGAGSGDFHTYRHSRNREFYRIRMMEASAKRDEKDKQFEESRKANVDLYEARTKKRAERRKRRKEHQREKAESGKRAKAGDSAESNQADEVEAEASLETPGGVTAIPNDGSFLDMMMTKRKETR